MAKVCLWVMAISYGLAETDYFGWNILPKSFEELVCDAITLFLTYLALTYREQKHG